jgi:hypothetical protein
MEICEWISINHMLHVLFGLFDGNKFNVKLLEFEDLL